MHLVYASSCRLQTQAHNVNASWYPLESLNAHAPNAAQMPQEARRRTQHRLLCNNRTCATRSGCLCDPLAVYLVNKVDNDVILLYAHAVEMLAHGHGELLLGLPSEGPVSARHGRRVEPNAPWPCKNELVVRAGEGRRRGEAVLATVRVQRGAVERGPVQL